MAMTARNDLDLNNLVKEVDETLTKLVGLFQTYYASVIENNDIKQFVNKVFGSSTVLITSLRKACNLDAFKTELPKLEIPPGAEVYIKLNELMTEHALLSSINTGRIPELNTLISDFLKTPNDTETEIYKSLKTECNKSLALLKKLDPIVKILIAERSAEIAAFDEMKIDSTAPKPPQ